MGASSQNGSGFRKLSAICLMISVNRGKMGGLGSGRHWTHKAKRSTTSCPALDARCLSRKGRLRPGQSFPYAWMRCGERAASIEVTTQSDQVTLLYLYRHPDGEIRRMECPVPIERTACHYGGLRVWFRCPQQGCGRRVAILYGSITFACRHCHGLAYGSQRCSATSRALRRAQAIRQRVGGTANMYDPFPERPKGMHWQTYDELRRQHDNAEANSWPGWLLRRVSRAYSKA